MTPTRFDKEAAKANPWGLTAHQCMSLRLLVLHGNAKLVDRATGIPAKTVQSNVENARIAMGLTGYDQRIYVMYALWANQYAAENNTKPIFGISVPRSVDPADKQSRRRRASASEVAVGGNHAPATGGQDAPYQPGTRLRGSWPVQPRTGLDALAPSTHV